MSEERSELERLRRLKALEEKAAQADPSLGGGTFQFGPFDTGIELPQGVNRFLAGTGKAFIDIIRGTEQLGRKLVPGVSEREQQLQREIDESRKLDAPLMATGAGLAGNITGNVAAFAPAAAIPGAATLPGAALLGGGMGATQPVATDESRALNVGLGAAGGLAGAGVSRGISRALAPKTAPEVTQLMAEGVTPTPGQIMGGAASRIEQGATSIPVVGDVIRGAQRRAIVDLNKAAINRALAPVGGKATGAGREAVEEAYKLISSKYDDILPNIKNVVSDEIFVGDVQDIVNMAQMLPDDKLGQLSRIVTTKVGDKIAKKGMSGPVLKEIDSELGRIGAGLRASPDFDARELGSLVEGVKRSLRGLVARTNPEHAAELAKIDEAYALLLRVENAAGRAGSKEGVFSPAALRAATKQMDRSMRGRKFAHGQALMQDLAEAGERVLGPTVPDSGTPFRTTGLLGGFGAAVYAPVETTATLAAGSAPYTRAGQQIMAALLAQRPEMVRQLGTQMVRVNPYAAILGSSALRSSQNQ